MIDAALEFSVVGSFTRLGPQIRGRLFRWEPHTPFPGRVCVVTGATSGIGRETARSLAALGARTVMVARDRLRAERVRDEIVAATGNGDVVVVEADMGDLHSVRRAAEALRALGPLDVLIHNAGSLSRSAEVTPQGLEQTVAVQVVGPFLLTQLVMESLSARGSRVIWVTSGGMYTQALSVAELEEVPEPYDGVRAYARAKRAQVSLVERWAPTLAADGVTMVAMHPGWTDTKGVQESLPGFYRVMRRLLRTTAQGADTILWLVSTPTPIPAGTLWLDRRARTPHRLSRTRRSDTPKERERLWQFCQRNSGL